MVLYVLVFHNTHYYLSTIKQKKKNEMMGGPPHHVSQLQIQARGRHLRYVSVTDVRGHSAAAATLMVTVRYRLDNAILVLVKC